MPKLVPFRQPRLSIANLQAAIEAQLRQMVAELPPDTLTRLQARITEIDPEWLAYALAEIRSE